MALTIDMVRRLKSDSRKSDMARIAGGEATPWQIQKENSIFPMEGKWEILNFDEAAEYYGSQHQAEKRAKTRHRAV